MFGFAGTHTVAPMPLSYEPPSLEASLGPPPRTTGRQGEAAAQHLQDVHARGRCHKVAGEASP
eukprot:COSAG01_NODE_28623_length_656_cov_3.631957_1_plen_62_part_01